MIRLNIWLRETMTWLAYEPVHDASFSPLAVCFSCGQYTTRQRYCCKDAFHKAGNTKYLSGQYFIPHSAGTTTTFTFAVFLQSGNKYQSLCFFKNRIWYLSFCLWELSFSTFCRSNCLWTLYFEGKERCIYDVQRTL